MDFIVGLPESERFNAVWVVVDRPTKMQYLVPCTDKVDQKVLEEMYVKEVFRLHGLAETIVSDRGLQFPSESWKHLWEKLGIKRQLSTTFHIQANGPTERVDTVMEQYLRNFVNYQQDHWVQWLPFTEIAANNRTLQTTNCSVFFGNYSFHPQMAFGEHPIKDPNDIC
jgi:hypothetical protein